MADWMYERLSAEYVLDDENRKFMAESNPWALHSMAERLLEAAGRGMWAQPDQGHPRRACATCCSRRKATSKARLVWCQSLLLMLPSPSTSWLTTFTKDGRAKPTAIWAAPAGDRLVVITQEQSWKVKRIRNTARVTIAACDRSGKP